MGWPWLRWARTPARWGYARCPCVPRCGRGSVAWRLAGRMDAGAGAGWVGHGAIAAEERKGFAASGDVVRDRRGLWRARHSAGCGERGRGWCAVCPMRHSSVRFGQARSWIWRPRSIGGGGFDFSWMGGRAASPACVCRLPSEGEYIRSASLGCPAPSPFSLLSPSTASSALRRQPPPSRPKARSGPRRH